MRLPATVFCERELLRLHALRSVTWCSPSSIDWCRLGVSARDDRAARDAGNLRELSVHHFYRHDPYVSPGMERGSPRPSRTTVAFRTRMIMQARKFGLTFVIVSQRTAVV